MAKRKVRVRNEEPLDLAAFGGHFGEAAWCKLAMGLYPGNQGEQRDALKADLGVRPEDEPEYQWLEDSYLRALDKFFWVYALGRLSAYNEGLEGDHTNVEAKDWMREAETRTYND